MVEITPDRHFQRLTEVVDYSYLQQRADRAVHHLLIRHMMGEYYPTRSDETGIETSINLMSMAARGMSRYLVSKSPRAMAHAADRRYKGWSEDSEIALNERLVNSDAARVLREAVDQSMVSMGILFLGADYVGTPDGMRMDLVFSAVDRADYVYDIASTVLEGADFQGHKYRMPIQDVRDHPWFSEDKLKVDPSPQNGWPDTDQTHFRRAFG